MKTWKINSYTYYRWWLKSVGFDYLTPEQQDRVSRIMEDANTSDDWYVEVSRKALSQRTYEIRRKQNTKGRILGRSAEQKVVNYLLSKAWVIQARPSQDLYPAYGTSTSGYDIIATHGDVTIKIEVKGLSESLPLWTLDQKCYSFIMDAGTDYLAIVKGEEIAFVAVKDLVFDEPVYVHDAIWNSRKNYERDEALPYLLVINPMCLNKISININ